MLKKKIKLNFLKKFIFITNKLIFKSIYNNNNIVLKKKIIKYYLKFYKKNKNLCLFSNRRKGLINKINFSRHYFNKFLKLNLIQNINISSW